MGTLTLSIPDELKHEMEDSPEINWSEIARAAIRDKLLELKLLKSIASKSKLTEKDALELGRMLRKSVHERHVKKYGA